jgi:5-methylcytosine-specific restriction protein A
MSIQITLDDDERVRRIRETKSKYKKRNPHKGNEYGARRRARMYAAAVGDQSLVRDFYQHVKTAKRIRCHWCQRWAKLADRTVDHIQPIVAGGAHSVGNLCCACRSCNCRKNDKPPERFTGQFEMIFADVRIP